MHAIDCRDALHARQVLSLTRTDAIADHRCQRHVVDVSSRHATTASLTTQITPSFVINMHAQRATCLPPSSAYTSTLPLVLPHTNRAPSPSSHASVATTTPVTRLRSLRSGTFCHRACVTQSRQARALTNRNAAPDAHTTPNSVHDVTPLASPCPTAPNSMSRDVSSVCACAPVSKARVHHSPQSHQRQCAIVVADERAHDTQRRRCVWTQVDAQQLQ
jgi:hypothetical protein